jgi:methyl-accepting chemotaxis protein
VAISDIDRITQENAASAEEEAAAASELKSQAASLNETAGRLRDLVEGGPRGHRRGGELAESTASSVPSIGAAGLGAAAGGGRALRPLASSARPALRP